MNEEIKLMNRIIYGAIVHGGDAGGPYCCDTDEVAPWIEEWLRLKGFEAEYMVSKHDWCFIIPVDQEDTEDYEEKMLNEIATMKPNWKALWQILYNENHK